MDISKLKAKKDGVWFAPDINGEPLGIEFLVVGRNTDEYIRRAKLLANKNAKKLDMVEEGLSLLCACVKDWKGIEDGGVSLECTLENKRKFFDDPQLFYIREMIEQFIADDSNFL